MYPMTHEKAYEIIHDWLHDTTTVLLPDQVSAFTVALTTLKLIPAFHRQLCNMAYTLKPPKELLPHEP